MYKSIFLLLFFSLTSHADLSGGGLTDYYGNGVTSNFWPGTRNPLDVETVVGGTVIDPRTRGWTLLNTTDSVNAVQSGVWTMGRTWSLSSSADSIDSVQSGVWNITNVTGTVSLPTGASTLAAQNTGNASLASIDLGIPTGLGQTTMANSMPVVIPSDQTLSTKTPLTPNAPFSVSVGVTSGTFLASNTARKGLCSVNLSGATVCYGLNGAAAVLNSGICLYPGGTWCMDEFSFSTGAITAIAGATASVSSGQEYQ